MIRLCRRAFSYLIFGLLALFAAPFQVVANTLIADEDGWRIERIIDQDLGQYCSAQKTSERGRTLRMRFYEWKDLDLQLSDPTWQIDISILTVFVDVGDKWQFGAVGNGDTIQMGLVSEQAIRFLAKLNFGNRITFRNKDSDFIDNFNIDYDLSFSFYRCVLDMMRPPAEPPDNNPFD